MIDPTLLSPTAAESLTAAGWSPGRDLGSGQVSQWRLRYTVAHDGVVDEASSCWNDAATEFLRSFGGLAVNQSGAGVDLARNSFTIEPLLLVHWARPLAIRSRELETVLAPIGRVENGAAIALSSDNRVYLIDHSSDWAYEPGLERGLSDLLDGVLPPTRLAL